MNKVTAWGEASHDKGLARLYGSAMRKCLGFSALEKPNTAQMRAGALAISEAVNALDEMGLSKTQRSELSRACAAAKGNFRKQFVRKLAAAKSVLSRSDDSDVLRTYSAQVNGLSKVLKKLSSLSTGDWRDGGNAALALIETTTRIVQNRNSLTHRIFASGTFYGTGATASACALILADGQHTGD